MANPLLYDTLKAGYSNDTQLQTKTLSKSGYIRDDELSNNKNRQVYFNPTTNSVLYNSNGTQTLNDWKNNVLLGLGQIKSTDRYKNDKKTLEKAKKKYEGSDVTLTGHSQAGGILPLIAGKKDKVVTYNGAKFGEKINKNEQHYRVASDPVSILSAKNKRTTTIQGPSVFPTYSSLLTGPSLLSYGLNSHNLENLKNKNIRV